MMRPFKSLTPLPDARRIIIENIREIERVEVVKIEDALNRILASDIISEIDVPSFHRASMDGFACIAEDTFNAEQFSPKVLRVVDVVHAGSIPRKGVKRGECIRIATGAMLPDGANAVIRVEDTETDGNQVKIFKPSHPFANVSKRGEDIKARELVLRKGEYLNPGRIGVLASLGIQKVEIFEKPKTAVIPTGNEIAELGDELSAGKVYDINTYTLSSIIIENNCIPVCYDIVRDERNELERAIRDALKYDMIIISGGSSVGERDLLSEILSELGKVLFHGVQVKPGKPTLFAIVDDKPIFGMPGYPTACLMSAYTLLTPGLRAMARLPEREEVVKKKVASRRIVSSLGRFQFLTVRIEGDYAVPVYKESGAITSMANAQGYIEIPSNIDLIEKGDEVEVRMF